MAFVSASRASPSSSSSYSLVVLSNRYGVDVSTSVSSTAWKCLRSANLRFAIVRCYRSNGRADTNCAGNVQRASSAGLEASIYA